MRQARLAAFALLTAACGQGGLVAAAEKAADEACARADYDCAKAVVAAMNKISFKESDGVKALAAEDKTKYDAAIAKMSECRDKLK